MKTDYIEFGERTIPKGFLITFRCYGTWLHGDERGSVDRLHRAFGTPMLPPNVARTNHDRRLLRQPPVTLNSRRRGFIEKSIRLTCACRKWSLWTLNVRSNHV